MPHRQQQSGLLKAYDGRLVIPVAGTPLSLWSTMEEAYIEAPKVAAFLKITANSDNASVVSLGGRFVVATEANRTGLPLEKGEPTPWFENVCLDCLYINVLTANDGVQFFYWGVPDESHPRRA